MNKHVILNNIAVYSFTHALIDATCVGTLFAVVSRGQHEPNTSLLILFYNALAFSTQPLFGLLVDKFNVPKISALAGILLVGFSPFFMRFPFSAIILAGLGNALFHIGGGVIILNLSDGKASLPGIFVAPGALGLTIGILLGKSGNFIAWPFLIMLLCAVLLVLKIPAVEIPTHRNYSGNLKWFEMVIFLLLISITIRSMVGLGLVFPWKTDLSLLYILTGAIVAGKALGGVLGDKYGWTEVAVTGLAASVPLLIFFPQIPILAILGLFLFNLSMSITLTCLVRMMPGRNGFAFGLTTLALFIGALPSFSQLSLWASRPVVIGSAVIISTIALYFGLRLYKRHFQDLRNSSNHSIEYIKGLKENT
jgi:MFS transporter, FSR family, fosmidomycin resistance protein